MYVLDDVWLRKVLEKISKNTKNKAKKWFSQCQLCMFIWDVLNGVLGVSTNSVGMLACLKDGFFFLDFLWHVWISELDIIGLVFPSNFLFAPPSPSDLCGLPSDVSYTCRVVGVESDTSMQGTTFHFLFSTKYKQIPSVDSIPWVWS